MRFSGVKLFRQGLIKLSLVLVVVAIVCTCASAQTADPSWAYSVATVKASGSRPMLIFVSKIYTTGGDVNGRAEQRLHFKEYLHSALKIDADRVQCYEWTTEADARQLRAEVITTGITEPHEPPKQRVDVKEVDWIWDGR